MLKLQEMKDSQIRTLSKYAFFTDELQANLKTMAVFGSERFEETLKIYRDIFLHYFKQLLTEQPLEHIPIGSDLPEFDPVTMHVIGEEDIEFICSEHVIEYTFELIINSYSEWCNYNLSGAEEQIRELLDHCVFLPKYLDPIDIGNHIMYRGRVSDQILSKEEMFHIPFNKRYMIANQRYSLVGHPILYLSMSPLCIIMELNAYQLLQEQQSAAYLRLCKELKLSSFMLKPETRFDRPIFQLINPYIDKTYQQVRFDDSEISFHHNKVKSELSRFILYQCCSFSIQERYGCDENGQILKPPFIEEYVLPQILAQTLKQKDYGGILYKSIKSFHNLNVNPILLYNIALFTNYNSRTLEEENYLYDKKLYEMFQIQPPISFAEYSIVDKLNLSTETILHTLLDLNTRNTTYTGVLIKLSDILTSNCDSYWKSPAGKLHLLLLYKQIMYMKFDL